MRVLLRASSGSWLLEPGGEVDAGSEGERGGLDAARLHRPVMWRRCGGLGGGEGVLGSDLVPLRCWPGDAVEPPLRPGGLLLGTGAVGWLAS